MSPSRGSAAASISAPDTQPEITTDAKADLKSSSALRSLRNNLKYLVDPASPTAPRPIHLRTRAFLRSLRFIGIFVFWRIVRYAKYALVGSIIAAVGATAFGGAVSGVGFLLAPPTLATSVGIGAIWAIGKWGFRKMGVGEKAGEGAVRDVRKSEEGVRRDGTWKEVQGPRAMPW